jgi:hypothetical protein
MMYDRFFNHLLLRMRALIVKGILSNLKTLRNALSVMILFFIIFELSLALTISNRTLPGF